MPDLSTNLTSLNSISSLSNNSKYTLKSEKKIVVYLDNGGEIAVAKHPTSLNKAPSIGKPAGKNPSGIIKEKYAIVTAKTLNKYIQESKPPIPKRPEGYKKPMDSAAQSFKPSAFKPPVPPRPSKFPNDTSQDKSAISSKSTPPLTDKKIVPISINEISSPFKDNEKEKSTELLKKEEEIQSSLDSLLSRAKVINGGKKLTLNSEEMAIQLSSSIVERHDIHNPEKEVFKSLTDEMGALLDTIETFGSMDHILQLRDNFSLCIEGSWVNQAIKNKDPEIKECFEKVNSAIQDCSRKQIEKEVIAGLEQLKTNPLIIQALTAEASPQDIEKAITLLDRSADMAYGLSHFDRQDVQELYKSTVDIQKKIVEFNDTISIKITEKSILHNLENIFSKAENSSPAAPLSEKEVSYIKDILDKYSTSSLLPCFIRLSNTAFSALKEQLFQIDSKEDKNLTSLKNQLSSVNRKKLNQLLLQNDLAKNIERFFLDDVSGPKEWESALSNFPLTIFSHSQLNTDQIIDTISSFISLSTSLSRSSENKALEFIVKILGFHAGTALLTANRIELLRSMKEYVSEANRSIIDIAADKALEQSIFALDENRNPIKDAKGNPVLFSTFASTSQAEQKEIVGSQALTLLATTSDSPEQTVEQIFGSAINTPSQYKAQVEMLAQEFRTLQEASFKSMPIGIVALNEKRINNELAIIQQSELFNRTAAFCTESIIKMREGKGQIKIAEFFLDVMQASIDQGNYATAKAIYVAFEKGSLQSLLNMDAKKNGAGQVGKKQIHIFNEAKALFSPQGNDSNIRAAIMERVKIGEPIIPFFGTYTKDHLFTFEGNNEEKELSLTKIKVLGEIGSKIAYIKNSIKSSDGDMKSDLLESLKKTAISEEQSNLNEGVIRVLELRNKVKQAGGDETSHRYHKLLKSTSKASAFFDQNQKIEEGVIHHFGKVLLTCRGLEKRIKVGLAFEESSRKYIEEQLKLKKQIPSSSLIIEAGMVGICENADISILEKKQLLESVYNINLSKENSVPFEIEAEIKELALQFSKDIDVTGNSRSVDSFEKELRDAYLLTSGVKNSDQLIGTVPIKGLLSKEVEEKVAARIIEKEISMSEGAEYADSSFSDLGTESTIENRSDEPLNRSSSFSTLSRSESVSSFSSEESHVSSIETAVKGKSIFASLNRIKSGLKTQSEKEIEEPKNLGKRDRLRYQAALRSVSKAAVFLNKNPNLKEICKSIADSLAKETEGNLAKVRNNKKIEIYGIIQNFLIQKVANGKEIADISHQDVLELLYNHATKEGVLSFEKGIALMGSIFPRSLLANSIITDLKGSKFQERMLSFCEGNRSFQQEICAKVVFSVINNLLYEKQEKDRSKIYELSSSNIIDQAIISECSLFQGVTVENRLNFFENLRNKQQLSLSEPFQKSMDQLIGELEKGQTTYIKKNSPENYELLMNTAKLCMITDKLLNKEKEGAEIDLELLEKISQEGAALFKRSPDAKTLDKYTQEVNKKEEFLISCRLSKSKSKIGSDQNITEIYQALSSLKDIKNALPAVQKTVKQTMEGSFSLLVKQLRMEANIIDYPKELTYDSEAYASLDPVERLLFDSFQNKESVIYMGNFGFSKSEIEALDIDSTWRDQSMLQDLDTYRRLLIYVEYNEDGSRKLDMRPSAEFRQSWANFVEKTDQESHKIYLRSHNLDQYKKKYPNEFYREFPDRYPG